MLETKVQYVVGAKGVTVHLDTDDPDYVAAFERACEWDSPLLKLKKEKPDGQEKRTR